MLAFRFDLRTSTGVLHWRQGFLIQGFENQRVSNLTVKKLKDAGW